MKKLLVPEEGVGSLSVAIQEHLYLEKNSPDRLIEFTARFKAINISDGWISYSVFPKEGGNLSRNSIECFVRIDGVLVPALFDCTSGVGVFRFKLDLEAAKPKVPVSFGEQDMD